MKQVILAFVLASLSTGARAQPNYPLTCVFDGKQGVSIQQGPSGPAFTNVSFSFVRATRPASQGVDAGTCAWQDRGMSPKEPNIILAVIPSGFTYWEVVYKDVPMLVYTPTGALWAPQAKAAGYKITFKVYQSAPAEGMAVSFFRIVN